jgi:ribosomal 50S subunit-associated protein YjgA (DUF615 family)
MLKQYTEADIVNIIIEIQYLGNELKNLISCLQKSPVKEYLLMEVSKIIELKTAKDFYYMKNRISRMLGLVIRFETNEKVQDVLEKISTEIEKIVKYIEMEREVY